MNIQIWSNQQKDIPSVYIHSFQGNGQEIWNLCNKIGCPPFNLISIYDFQFNDNLSPWPAENIWKGQPPFKGYADNHLESIIHEVIPYVESQLKHPSSYLAMAGYSMAGLFTFYSAWRVSIFKRLACASASFWYPKFVEYVEKQPMVSHPECIYFSLGNKESQTRHPLMSQVAAYTEKLHALVVQKDINTVFEINAGNHFTETDLRMAKAISWMLKQ